MWTLEETENCVAVFIMETVGIIQKVLLVWHVSLFRTYSSLLNITVMNCPCFLCLYFKHEECRKNICFFIWFVSQKRHFNKISECFSSSCQGHWSILWMWCRPEPQWATTKREDWSSFKLMVKQTEEGKKKISWKTFMIDWCSPLNI